MIYEIPLENDSTSYFKKIDLDNVVYQVKFEFNNALESWVFELKTVSGDTIYKGVARPNIDVIRNIQHENKPKGRLFFLSLEPTENEPGRFDLGDSVYLAYDDEV